MGPVARQCVKLLGICRGGICHAGVMVCVKPRVGPCCQAVREVTRHPWEGVRIGTVAAGVHSVVLHIQGGYMPCRTGVHSVVLGVWIRVREAMRAVVAVQRSVRVRVGVKVRGTGGVRTLF